MIAGKGSRSEPARKTPIIPSEKGADEIPIGMDIREHITVIPANKAQREIFLVFNSYSPSENMSMVLCQVDWM